MLAHCNIALDDYITHCLHAQHQWRTYAFSAVRVDDMQLAKLLWTLVVVISLLLEMSHVL